MFVFAMKIYNSWISFKFCELKVVKVIEEEYRIEMSQQIKNIKTLDIFSYTSRVSHSA